MLNYGLSCDVPGLNVSRWADMRPSQHWPSFIFLERYIQDPNTGSFHVWKAAASTRGKTPLDPTLPIGPGGVQIYIRSTIRVFDRLAVPSFRCGHAAR